MFIERNDDINSYYHNNFPRVFKVFDVSTKSVSKKITTFFSACLINFWFCCIFHYFNVMFMVFRLNSDYSLKIAVLITS